MLDLIASKKFLYLMDTFFGPSINRSVIFVIQPATNEFEIC